jgi:hypothetical protein
MGCQLFLIVIALIAGLCVGGLRRSIKQADEQETESKPKHRVTGTWAFLGVLTVLTLTWNWACFSRQKSSYELLSPDAAWKLVADKRCAFPRDQIIEPSLVIGFRLIDAKTGQTLAYSSAKLSDNSYVMPPTVTWNRDGAQVSGFSSSKDVQLDLVVPKN